MRRERHRAGSRGTSRPGTLPRRRAPRPLVLRWRSAQPSRHGDRRPPRPAEESSRHSRSRCRRSGRRSRARRACDRSGGRGRERARGYVRRVGTTSCSRAEMALGPAVLPDCPGGSSGLGEQLQRAPILEGVHRCPEPLVLVHLEEIALDQPLERLVYELLPRLHEIEHVGAENEVAPVDPDIGVVDVADRRDVAVGARLERCGRCSCGGERRGSSRPCRMHEARRSATAAERR